MSEYSHDLKHKNKQEFETKLLWDQSMVRFGFIKSFTAVYFLTHADS